jgi:hypothetical protein
MRNYLLLLFISSALFPVIVSGQMAYGKLDVSGYAGYATYKMEMLKELNQSIEESLPFDVKSVNNFDPGFYFGASVQSRLSRRFSFGLVFQYHTTGSRFGQKDYSGSYTFDQIANCYLAAVRAEISILDKESYTLSASVTSGALFTGLDIYESFILFETEHNTSASFSAVSAAIYPEVNFSVPVTHRFIWFLSIGRMFDTGGKFHLSDNKDAVLKVNEKAVNTGWSGWSISTGLKFIIIK